MDAAHARACELDTAAEALDSFRREVQACPVAPMGHALWAQESKLIALVLDLAVALAPQDSASEQSTSSMGPYHVMSALLTLWVEARVTLTEADERRALRAVQHRGEALLWRACAWLNGAEDEKESDRSSLANLLDTTVTFVAALDAAKSPSSSVPRSTCSTSTCGAGGGIEVVRSVAPWGSPSWFMRIIETCFSLCERAEDGNGHGDVSVLAHVLKQTFVCEAYADPHSLSTTSVCHLLLARPVAVSSAVLGSLFALRARVLKGVSQWLIQSVRRRPRRTCENAPDAPWAADGMAAALTAVSSVYARLLVAASDAATIAHEQFGQTDTCQSTRAGAQAELLAGADRHLWDRASRSAADSEADEGTEGCYGDDQAAVSTVGCRHRSTSWVHPSVQVSGLRSRVVSGIGFVAAEPIHEGECVLVEAPIVAYTRSSLTDPQNSDRMSHLRSVATDLLMNATQWLSSEDDAEEVAAAAAPRSPSPPSPDGHTASLLRHPFARLMVVSSLTQTPSAKEPMPLEWDLSQDAVLERLLTALTAPQRHLVKPITGLDTFKIGLPCDEELGVAVRQSNDWAYLRAVDEGKCIGYLVSLLNHSCAANALVLTTPTGEALSVVALRPINAGEEITLSYLPSTLLPQKLKEEALGFVCQCEFCSTRGPLLESVRCGECGHYLRPEARCVHKLHRDSGGGGVGGGHATDCPARHTAFVQWRDALLPPLEAQVARAEAGLATGAPEDTAGTNDDQGGDVFTETVRVLVALDEQLEAQPSPFLPIHYVRLRLREHALAFAVAASELSRALSASLQRIAAELVESVALLLPHNAPFLTDLRMHYVFVRARHLSDVLEAERAATADPTAGHADDCCGAVRHETAVLRKPYVRDAMVRHAVIRSFQEHHVQWVRWRQDLPTVGACSAFPMCDPLKSFLLRFPVELQVAGVEAADDLEMLACMDGDE